MWAWELKALRVKRSAPYRNSLQEEFCDIQLTPRVAAGERLSARCMATAIGPPEEKMATCSPRWPEARNLVRPEFTRAQNSCQVSTPCGASSAFTHLPITVSNNFWNVARCVAWSGEVTAFQRIDVTAQFLRQAALALDLAQGRYNLGLSSIVELTQAQLNLTQAEIENLSAKYDYQNQYSVVQYTVGALH